MGRNHKRGKLWKSHLIQTNNLCKNLSMKKSKNSIKSLIRSLRNLKIQTEGPVKEENEQITYIYLRVGFIKM